MKSGGFVIPNNGSRYPDTKWLLHEAASIEIVYPVDKEANNASYLDKLSKAKI